VWPPVIITGCDQECSISIDIIERLVDDVYDAVLAGMGGGGWPATGTLQAQLTPMHSLSAQSCHEILVYNVKFAQQVVN
jgi:hypothetical protein